MLSRTAERMYWLGRYVERAENTARLVGVHSTLLLDLPRSAKLVWQTLTDIIDSTPTFFQQYEVANERNVVRFMLADESNSSSLLCSIRAARENVRTAREILPSSAWEQINEFYLFARENMQQALTRAGRHEYLDGVQKFCNQITGLLFGTMSHNDAYNFIRVGRNLERADMTTRIFDVGSANLLGRGDEPPVAYENLLWMSVLRSLSAFQMYRQNVRDRVNAEDVVEFLLKDREFPRAVAHCLEELNVCMNQLPRNENPLRVLARVRRMVAEVEVPELIKSGLHEYIDRLQLELSHVHAEVVQTWFDVEGVAREPAGGV